MGTAGPLALARDILDDGSGSPFFVLNRCAHAAALLPRGSNDAAAGQARHVRQHRRRYRACLQALHSTGRQLEEGACPGRLLLFPLLAA